MSSPNTPASNDFVLVREAAQQLVDRFPADLPDYSPAADEVKALRLALASAPASPEPLNKEQRNNAELLASICQKARHSSASPVERDEALRDAATMLRDFARSVVPATSPEPASNEAPGRGGASGTGEYQPDVWQVVVDQLGYESVHETDEDGRPGDLVAHVYGDNVSLVSSAPGLRKALTALLAIAGTPITDSQGKVFAQARAALAASQVAK